MKVNDRTKGDGDDLHDNLGSDVSSGREALAKEPAKAELSEGKEAVDGQLEAAEEEYFDAHQGYLFRMNEMALARMTDRLAKEEEVKEGQKG